MGAGKRLSFRLFRCPISVGSSFGQGESLIHSASVESEVRLRLRASRNQEQTCPVIPEKDRGDSRD